MASRRQTSRLSKKALATNIESKLSVKNSLKSNYVNDLDHVKSESIPMEASKALKQPKIKGRQAKSKIYGPVSPPDNWKSVFEAIKEYRKSTLAPVDTMGCERLSERHVDEKV